MAVTRHEDQPCSPRKRVPGLNCAVASLLALLVSAGASGATLEFSVARQWNEETLSAVRRDFARPTVHARNLWHVSVAMWDAWVAYDEIAATYLHHERASAADIELARAEAISYACYRILRERFTTSPGAAVTQASLNAKMTALGYDRNFTSTEGDTPAALGNRIAATVLAFGAVDGSNEAGGYVNQFYTPINPPLIPALPGNPDLIDPNRWQPLAIDFFVDQAGNPILEGFPEFLSPEWGQVSSFALSTEDRTINSRGGFDYWVFHDPGPPPEVETATDDDYKWGCALVSIWSSHLDPGDGVMWDISPGALGNAPLPEADDFRSFYDLADGGDWGTGHTLNPITGEPYDPQVVPRGDYARVLAEFWADGPDSETPPGHWFVIANYVSDHPQLAKRIKGQGAVVNDLEWDVKLYFALGGAMHDSAVAVWGIKGWYDYIRPVSAIRYLASHGQSSDVDGPYGPYYDSRGITLHPGKIEVITADSSDPGERHNHLAFHRGKIALHAWRGPDFITDPDVDEAGVGWILADNWWPYQRPTFVTPPFAGYVSGHSAYSRAGATILGLMTGSEFFPGGLGEFHCPRNEFLVFEEGPSVDLTLQWATYKDASDQTSLSRIWGGIHPPADDIPGRHIGEAIGADAMALAESFFGTPDPGVRPFRRSDSNDDGVVDLSDAVNTLNWLFVGTGAITCQDAADANDDNKVDLSDPITTLEVLFSGQGEIPPPGLQTCGPDPVVDGLSCESFQSCSEP